MEGGLLSRATFDMGLKVELVRKSGEKKSKYPQCWEHCTRALQGGEKSPWRLPRVSEYCGRDRRARQNEDKSQWSELAGGTGIRARCLQAQIFAGWEAWRGPDGVSDGSWSPLDYLRFLMVWLVFITLYSRIFDHIIQKLFVQFKIYKVTTYVQGSHNPTWGNYNSSGPLAAIRIDYIKVTLSNSELDYSYWFISIIFNLLPR